MRLIANKRGLCGLFAQPGWQAINANVEFRLNSFVLEFRP